MEPKLAPFVPSTAAIARVSESLKGEKDREKLKEACQQFQAAS